MTCPQKNSDEWKELVKAVGEDKAIDAYTLNGSDIPTPRQAKRLLNALVPVDGDKDANRFVSQSEVPDTLEQRNKTVISQERIDNGISQRINKFLTDTGIGLHGVDRLTDSNGDAISGLAKAEMVQKTILFTKGRLDIKQLGEEAAHFYVEMLDSKSDLYKQMYNNIDKFGIHDEVVATYGDQYQMMYKDEAVDRIKKEAMAQLINQHIVGDRPFESGPKQAFAIRWWDKLVDYIKSIFGKASPEKFTDEIVSDPYYKASQNILESNLRDLDLQKNLTGEYYQLSPKQKDIVDRILDKDSKITLDESDHSYSILGKKLKESVTQIVERLNPFKGQIDPIEKKMYQDAGTQLHSYIQNSIKRAVEEQTGNVTTKPLGSSPIIAKIDKYFSEFVNRPEFKGAQFLTEVKMADEKRSVGTTADLLIIEPSGKTHIFDWKSVNFKTIGGEVLDERVSSTKERNYNIQLREIRDILKTQYGVSDFGQIRIIPLQTIFRGELKNGTFVQGLRDINIGGDAKYLQPIVSEAEKTGVPALDNLLASLITRRHSLENSLATVSGTDLERAKQRQFINNKLLDIAHAITEIHTEHKVDQFLNYLNSEMDRLARTGAGSTDGTLDAYTDAQFEETAKNIEFFQQLLKENLSPIAENITGESKERLRQLATRFVEADSLIFNELQRRLQLKGTDVGISDITTADKQTGWWTTLFRYGSQQFNKKIATLWKLVDNQKQKVIRDHATINQEIEAKTKTLKEWGLKNGLSGIKVFSKMISKDGQSLAPKYSDAFRTKIREALDNHTIENLKFAKENTTFNQDAYERSLADKLELWRDRYGDNQDIIDKQTKWYENHYDATKSDDAYGNNNQFLSWKDDSNNHSEEYRYIYQKGNEPLKEFYEYFQQKTQEYRDVMGLKKDRNFIWNVKKDLAERIMSNGIGAFTKMPSILNQMESAEAEHTKEVLIDESGQKIQTLPKYFVNPILKAEKQVDGTIKMIFDKERKSQDLSKVLSLASAMALNYKYMSDIEDSAKVLRLGISQGQEIITDYRGRPVNDLVKGGVKTAVTSADTITHFNDLMNYYLYGVKNKSKDITFEFLGKKRSLLQGYSELSKYFTGKTLAFNSMSILANVIGGDVNARMLGVAGKYFDNAQYSKAFYKMLPSRDARAYTAMGYFDLMRASKVYEKANELSANNLTKHLTWDTLFIGHEKTDSWIRNSALLAMMQNHTINEDGLVVKKTRQDKSLYDMIEIKDGKFSLPNLSESEYYKFRNKAHTIGERILGNSTRDNIRGAHLTVLGRSLMMFRSWIPRMIDERFGELRHDYDIGEYEYGRYRAFGKTVFQDRIQNIAKNLTNQFADFGILGFKPWKGTEANAAINARIDELYYKSMADDPTSNISKEEFHQLYKDNLRSSMMELQLMTTMAIVLLGLKGATGSNKSSEQKFTQAVVSRSLSEMAFFTGLGFNDIMQNSVPIMSLVQQVSSFGKAAFVDTFEGPQPKTHKTAAQRVRGFFPVLYAFDRFEHMFEKGQ